MKWFLYAMSLIWIAFGAWAILYTSETKDFYKRLVNEIDRRIVSVLPFIAGILFLFAASATRNPAFIRFIGILALVKGVFIFWNPNNLYEEVANWYSNVISDQTFRLFGIISLVLGTAVLSWIM
ncbi:hypothetical protein ACFL0O_06405 [Thermodesulfobacteriota bacterium]